MDKKRNYNKVWIFFDVGIYFLLIKFTCPSAFFSKEIYFILKAYNFIKHFTNELLERGKVLKYQKRINKNN